MRTIGMCVLLLSLSACRTGPGADEQNDALDVAAQIRPEAIRAHMGFLADDALEGRGTGTRGHELAAKYIRSQLEAAGVRSGQGLSDFFQTVPLVRTRVDARSASFQVLGQNGRQDLVFQRDYVFHDTHRGRAGGASGRVVFVGYGVTAPELGHDDYSGLDVRGALVAFFGEAPATFPPAVRAYYSDHDVKRKNAARHGAIGILYVQSKEAEIRFPWPFVLRESQIGWNSLRWLGPDGNPGALDDSIQVAASLNRPGAEALFSGEEREFVDLLAAVETGDLPRFELKKTVSISYLAENKPVESVNVFGEITGSDPDLKEEYVVYTAHIDHLGIGPSVDGDSLYNGALDNASGCAAILEIARAFGSLPQSPKRSLAFLFVTGEEAGMVGSDYFAHFPTVPVDRIVANVNIDGAAQEAPVTDVLALGAEHSTLAGTVEQAAAETGLSVSPDPTPEEGFFVRSDQYSFVKRGIPSLFLSPGMQSADPEIDAAALSKRWLVTLYHSPKDDMSQPFHYENSAQFTRAAFLLGYRVAMDPAPPRWNEDSFFARFARAD